MERHERSVQSIAKRLRATRAALDDIKQAQFADGAGIARNTYNQWEKAKGRPSLDDAIKLADAYGLTLDWIYLGDASGLPLRIASRLAAPLLTIKTT